MIFRALYNVLPVTRLKILLAGFLYRLTRIFVWKNELQIVRNGIKYQIDLREGLDLSLFLFGNFQKHVSQNPLVKWPSDAVIIDVGANVGMMSLQFATKIPHGKVYAFEPTDYAFGKFKNNLKLNPDLAARIQVFKSFVSDKQADIADIVAYSSWKIAGGNEEGDNLHPVHSGTAKVTTGAGSVRLDDFVVMENLKRLDFIKIDTDGHEYEVLGGAKEAIERFRPTLIFEIGRYVMVDKGIDFDFYHHYFSKLNYKLLDAANGKEVTLENFKKLIPQKGTIDLLALPL